MYRKTYVEVNHKHLTENVKEIKKKYPDYKYYIGVVKNNAYHHGIKIVNALKEGGINYFAVSSLEEALDLRKYNVDIPILILEPIDLEFVYDCITNNITITIEDINDLKALNHIDLPYEIKIHLKLDTGMNRLGIKRQEDVEKCIQIISENPKMILEGIYTHFATSGIADEHWDRQLEKFKELTKNINLKEIPIVHLGRSLTLVNHKKIEFCNAIRLGIVMYGFAQSRKKDTSWKGKLRQWKIDFLKKKNNISETTSENNLNLRTAFSLYSQVMSVRAVEENEFVGYNANYKVPENAYIATIPIGYADGIDQSFKEVYINSKRYPIISDSMDMIMVLVDDKIKKGMKVEIFGENISIEETTRKIGKNAYHLFNQIQNRVPRVHMLDDEKEEMKY